MSLTEHCLAHVITLSNGEAKAREMQEQQRGFSSLPHFVKLPMAIAAPACRISPKTDLQPNCQSTPPFA